MIFLDMDETLLLTDPFMEGKAGAASFEIEGDKYHTLRRPVAIKLIEECRKIAETRILTMGTRDYANAAVIAAGLPFTPEQIVAREDYIEASFNGLFFTAKMRTDNDGHHPDAVLVDNQSSREGFAQIKMKWLGINEDRYIKISPFVGSDSKYDMEDEIKEILCKIKSLKS